MNAGAAKGSSPAIGFLMDGTISTQPSSPPPPLERESHVSTIPVRHEGRHNHLGRIDPILFEFRKTHFGLGHGNVSSKV